VCSCGRDMRSSCCAIAGDAGTSSCGTTRGCCTARCRSSRLPGDCCAAPPSSARKPSPEERTVSTEAELERLRRDVQYLKDRADILDCIAAHARGCDRHDVALLTNTYHDDGADEHG